MATNGMSAYLPGTIQNVSYTATAGLSAAFSAATALIRIVTTTDAYILISMAGTAVTSTTGVLMAAMVPEYFEVPKGGKASIIRSAVDGSANITEIV